MGYVVKRRGNYRARYRDPLGRVRSQTFAREGDAERFLREMEADVVRGEWLDPRDADTPLAEWADEFLRLARRLAPTTRETYERDLSRYVLPRFGAYRLGQLLAAADEIENWLNDEIDQGVAPNSVRRHFATLRRVLQVAVDKQKIPSNPCSRVEPPRPPEVEMVFLDWDEVVALAEAHAERYRALVYAAVDTGMRWGELIGLRRRNVDLRRRKVRVTEQLVRLQSGEWVRKEPKTAASRRSITISSVSGELLAEHLERFAGTGPEGLVFPNGAGNPLMSSSFRGHHFGRALERSGLSCRFHDLRHTSVALAIAEGAHPKAIQARMGHSSINVTLDRYGHLFPELDEAIATSFGERFSAARARRRETVVHAAFGGG